jgi:hypothetical protein
VSPVKYELGFYIPEDGILHSQRRENLTSYLASLNWGGGGFQACIVNYFYRMGDHRTVEAPTVLGNRCSTELNTRSVLHAKKCDS